MSTNSNISKHSWTGAKSVSGGRSGSQNFHGPQQSTAGAPASVSVTSLDDAKRYVRRNFIAKGSHKLVYHAFDEEEGIEVAWNEIDTSSIHDLSKVQREIHLLQQLNHPNIIRCHGSWLDEERRALVFITELMTSGTLSDFIAQQTSQCLKTHVMVKYCRQILSGLAYLASQDVIHRDLKANNIFVNGHKGEVKIGDLGLSIASRAANSVLGTPEYMAPEIYDENYTNAVDIWSFGMCMLQMVSGMQPYQECENVGQIFRKVTNGILPEAKDSVTDPIVKEVIFQCLALDADKRPSAVELLSHALFRKEVGDNVDSEDGQSNVDSSAKTESVDVMARALETATPSKDSIQSHESARVLLPSKTSDDDLLRKGVLEWIKGGPKQCQPAVANLALEHQWLDRKQYQEWHDSFYPPVANGESPDGITVPSPTNADCATKQGIPESISSVDDFFTATPQPNLPPKEAMARRASSSSLTQSEGQERVDKKKAAAVTEQKLLAQMMMGGSSQTLSTPGTRVEVTSFPHSNASSLDDMIFSSKPSSMTHVDPLSSDERSLAHPKPVAPPHREQS